ncbi:MAG TPA: hypothetical protein VFD23_05035, partial [Clostridia bacterium]|nr:hypothetical protein [Clostridia bacterium]
MITKPMRKSITKTNVIKFALYFFVIYVMVTGMFIFAIPKDISTEHKNNSTTDNYYSDTIGPDRAVLINDPLKAGVARIRIIENAKETLDISCFSIENGESSLLFFGALLEAADRGVQVNLLLDGMF